MRRIGDLDIAEDIDHERRVWFVERVGWVVLLLIVAAALLGLCGGAGPIGVATVGDETGPLSVEYPRFVRHSSPMTLEVRIGQAAAQDGQVRLWLDRAYLEHFLVEQVTPEPESVELGSDRLTFVFAVTGTAAPFDVTFNLRPERYWMQRGQIGLPEGPVYQWRQFVYP